MELLRDEVFRNEDVNVPVVESITYIWVFISPGRVTTSPGRPAKFGIPGKIV